MINHMLSTLIERVNGRQAYGKANDENEQKISKTKRIERIYISEILSEIILEIIFSFSFLFNENKMNSNVHSPTIKQQ